MSEEHKCEHNCEHEGTHTEEHKGGHEHHSSEHHKVQKKEFNYWYVVTGVLVLLLVMSFFTSGFKFFSSESVSKEEASQKTLDFINKNLLQGQATASVKEIKDEGSIYSMKLSVNGQEINSYVSKDGKLFFPQAIDVTQPLAAGTAGSSPQKSTEVIKSDKPTVELFVMSHCPYGTQAEKGILSAVEKLGDKVDFELKFVYYAMHGEVEVKEQMNQVCIWNEQKNKFNTYLKCFLKEGKGEECLATAGIDQDKLKVCVKKLDAEFRITEQFNDKTTWLSGRFPKFDVFKADNEKYSVAGSPTLIINGAEANSERSPAAYLKTICDAFNTAPVECSVSLPDKAFSPGFGYTQDEASAVAQCGN